MSNFQVALSFTLDIEAGLVNNPDDSGGISNLGITLPTMSAYLGRLATEQDITDLTPISASAIYEKLFWNPMLLPSVNDDDLALCIFNIGVNQGQEHTIQSLQLAFNSFGTPLIAVDGTIGPNTLTAINGLNAADSLRLILRFIEQCQLAYVKIGNPVFIDGWIARTHKLLELVFL